MVPVHISPVIKLMDEWTTFAISKKEKALQPDKTRTLH